ncbi:aminodeoxychorismate synthase component I [Marinicella meishanensis]|uniref:aminodeoxychorismate synthase component I n=1 Tax=Marinicella meishanensis TaxID=2873263 RepID=UPI001CBD9333|nr:aminodeoxychorismate synthase component I [Marinicella sp. NBU2979]
MIEIQLDSKPDLLALAATQSGFFPALLESQSVNEHLGRYDILMAAPSMEMLAYDREQLEQLLLCIDGPPNDTAGSAPFQWGWLVYFAYESAYFMEPKLAHLIKHNCAEPLALAVYCQGALVHDQIAGKTTLWAESSAAAAMIQAQLSSPAASAHCRAAIEQPKEDAADHFIQAVNEAKALIRAGDIYQANLSRQYRVNLAPEVTPAALFARLRQANPAPFSALLQVQNFAVVSSSPERLFCIKNGVIETRPIAGTRPRGDDPQADAAMIKELLETPKEQAEHIMLIDLERNDIGKVCRTGTVAVNELMVVESYQHVHHIVSNIKGTLKPDATVVDAIKALFPGGTITGCPKIRCMEIIHAIEQRDRGCYTGSLGYINHNGQVDLNILIRTVGMLDSKAHFNAGAGIVFDSDPDAELAETRHKAQGMINALQPVMTEPHNPSGKP